ncbi:hypothetical protein HN51_041819 [Arachis hypogaea]|uniref:uncharacterized protein n=1 Tax=Arachis hypogaea TaxID=3818 RepID=UPI000DEC7FE1|nr:uncharacterized protein LOC112755410 [Arachis hypogaea]QHN87648.1 uncharacterized protein DS421_16g556930 [Arachis hypogaea]
MIEQSGNVNYTRTYLREKAKKASKAALNSSPKCHNSSENVCSGRKRGRPKGSNGPRILSAEVGCVLSVELKSKFRPTKEMQLTLQECQMSLYVFGHDLYEGETLFKNKNTEMSRADFQCLILGNEVHSNILMLAALKTTMTQCIDDAFEDMSNKITTWSLPP